MAAAGTSKSASAHIQNGQASTSSYQQPQAGSSSGGDGEAQADGADLDNDFFPEEVVGEEQAAEVREEARLEEANQDSDGDGEGSDDGDIYEHPHGSIYTGEMAVSIPTSITTMRRRSRSKSDIHNMHPRRSQSGADDSDIDGDNAGTAMLLSRSARRSSIHSSRRRKSTTGSKKRQSTERQRSRRGSASSVASRESAATTGDGAASPFLRPRKARDLPPTAVESASSGSEDEEGGKKAKRRPGGMLSALFGNSTPKSSHSSRPVLDRAPSSASILSRSTRRSSHDTKRRKPHRRQSSSYFSRVSGGDALSPGAAGEEASEDEMEETDFYAMYSSSSVSTSTSSGSTATDSTGDDARSRRRKRRGVSGSMFLPSFGGGDPVFGAESRVDLPDRSPAGSPRGSDAEESDEEEPFFLDEITASRQTIYIPDEDLQILFEGWGEKTYKTILWNIGVVLSLGILSLLGKWIPEWWLQGRGKQREFGRASQVVVKTSHGTTYVVPIKKLSFPNPVPISTVFPPTSEPPPTSRNEAFDDSEDEATAAENTTTTTGPTASDGTATPKRAPSVGTNTPTQVQNGFVRNQISKTNGTNTPADSGSLKSGKEARLRDFKYVDFRYYRFFLHPISGNFHMSRDWKDTNWTSHKALRMGISDAQRDERRNLFGANTIEIEARSIGQLLLDECLHPFYVFQIASIILWFSDNYVAYAITIFLISVSSITSTLIETRSNVERMRAMSRFVCTIRVWRKGSWESADSSELVPGDLVDLADSSLHVFPADLVLLSGDAIVNESMLTGESVPVSKVPIDDSGVAEMTSVGGDVAPSLGKNFLFSGTRIVRVRRLETAQSTIKGGEAIGMVVRTGFNTTKGALVRSMLFPKPMGFKFYRDSFRFIGVLAGIAGLGFLGSSFNFVKLGIKWHTIVIRALDLVTIVVPPALPATMSIGTSFAIGRLRKKDIFCISPNRVNIGGKVNLVCFDKTGTLTEEGLDVLGVRSVDRTSKRFSELQDDVENVPIIGAADAKTPFVHALATCHGLKLVNGEVIGDPLDLRMFEFTKWTLEEGRESSRPSGEAELPAGKTVAKKTKSKNDRVPDRPAQLVQSVVRPPGGESFKLEDALKAGKKHAMFLELGVIRTFDFVSSLRRMSVLVKKLKSQTIEAYVKGAPEVMVDICDKDTLPDDYEEVLENYTKHGYRVIALAAKSIPALTWVKAQRLKREEVESNLRFLGLIVFENKLKPGTGSAIRTLLNAHIPCRMVTGDNIRTAVSVTRECGMINYHDHVYMPTFKTGDMMDSKAELEWTHVEDERLKLDSYSLKPAVPVSDTGSLMSFDMGERAYHLAVTGDVFRWMIDYGSSETLQRLLLKCVIYARMSPDEKHEIVERLQGLDYTVGFCGDGANDCGALKAADVGLSLSEAEASVAAPFTSRSTDISCFIDVIREGRAALVTSFSCFKFMALYSLIQFTTVTLLYALASSLGDFQFLYIDLAIIIPIAVTMGRTAAYGRLHPKRPTANLVSKKVLTSLIGQIFFTSALQFFVFFYVRAQSWYEPPFIDPDELDTVSYENSALFLISSFQYIIVAVVFCVGPPYRKPIHSNVPLLLTLVLLSAFSTYVVFAHYGIVFNLLGLVYLPREFQLELFLLAIGNTALSWIWEKHLALHVASQIGQLKRRIRRWRGTRREKEGKLYKLIERDMDD